MTERGYELLCVLEDSGGLLDLDDILFTLEEDDSEADSVKEELESLIDEGLAKSLKEGDHVFYRLSKRGGQYLNCPPPEGITI